MWYSVLNPSRLLIKSKIEVPQDLVSPKSNLVNT